MVKLLFPVLSTLLCVACAAAPGARSGRLENSASAGTVVNAATVADVPDEIGGRAIPDAPTIGPMEIHIFSSGVSADASGAGITYRLTIRHRHHSRDGVFRFERTFRTEGDTLTQLWAGRRYTLRGTAEDSDAVVWQCCSAEGPVFDFLRSDDGRSVRLVEVHDDGGWSGTVGALSLSEERNP